MTIKFVGKDLPIERIITGFWSFDNACANNRKERGFAVPAFVELYADEGVGKTTVATTLAGIIANKMDGNIAIVDWEIQDMTTLMDILSRQGFEGEFERILEKKDEDTMDKFYDTLENEKTSVMILDSIAAFVSMSEAAGKQTDANMGKRGWNMAKFSRRTIRNLQLRKSPAVVLATNHIYPTMGGFVAGHDTAGGRAKKYAATYRFLLKKAFWKKKKRTETIPKITGERPIGWVIEGRVEKSRMGYSLTNFYLAMIMGEGISKNLTAMYECLFFEQADLDRNVVKLKVGEEEYQELGHITEFISDRDNDKRFEPFKNALASMTDTPADIEEDEEEE